MDAKAFWSRKYNQLIPKMIGLCYRYIPDRQTAEDIAHDAFLTAIEKSESYRGSGDFAAWLRKITVNQALQYLRQQWSHRSEAFDESMVADPIEESEEAPEDDIIAVIQKADFTQEEILEAIGKLPEHHRTVFNLYVFEHKSHKEISDLMEISVGTSKSHLARARAKLQAILFSKAKQKRAIAMFMLPLFCPKAQAMDRIVSRKLRDFTLPPQTHKTLGGSGLANFPLPPLRLRIAEHHLPLMLGTVAVTAAAGSVILPLVTTEPSQSVPDLPNTAPLTEMPSEHSPAPSPEPSPTVAIDTCGSPLPASPTSPLPTESVRQQPTVPEGADTVAATAPTDGSRKAPVVVKKVKQKKVTVVIDTTNAKPSNP